MYCEQKYNLTEALKQFNEFLLNRSANKAYENWHRSECADYIKKVSDVIQIVEEF